MTTVAEPMQVLAPRLIAFYRDVFDEDGTATGRRTVAWGLVFGEGSAISISIELPVRVALWHTVLDAYVDHVDRRRTFDVMRNRQPPPCPSPLRPAEAEDTEAQGACPDRPTADRDRPLAGNAMRSGSAAVVPDRETDDAD